MQVTEQMLKAFGVEVCGDLIAKRALLSALFSKVTVDAAVDCRCRCCAMVINARLRAHVRCSSSALCARVKV